MTDGLAVPEDFDNETIFINEAAEGGGLFVVASLEFE